MQKYYFCKCSENYNIIQISQNYLTFLNKAIDALFVVALSSDALSAIAFGHIDWLFGRFLLYSRTRGAVQYLLKGKITRVCPMSALKLLTHPRYVISSLGVSLLCYFQLGDESVVL